MKPVRAKIEGYRRFGKPNVPIDLRGDLVAVVGPNEAGKSSLLEALQRIEDDEPIVDDDLTRNGDGTARIETEYRLDDGDLESLARRFDRALFGAVTHLVVSRDETGNRTVRVKGEVPNPSALIGTQRRSSRPPWRSTLIASTPTS